MKKALESSMYSIVLNGHQPIKPPIFEVHFCQFSQLLFIWLSAPLPSTLSCFVPSQSSRYLLQNSFSRLQNENAFLQVFWLIDLGHLIQVTTANFLLWKRIIFGSIWQISRSMCSFYARKISFDSFWFNTIRKIVL